MNLSGSQRSTPQRFLWFFLLLAVFAYCSPWLINRSVGLSLGAYDLAEWASLHPAVRMGSPVLLTSLLLRLPLVCLALFASFTAESSQNIVNRYLRAGFCLGIAAALLPPLEYLANPVGDANYGQQLALSMTAFVGSVVGLSGRLKDWVPTLNVLWAILGGIAAIAGLVQAHNLMREFELSVQISISALVVTLVFGLVTLLNFTRRAS